MRNAHLIAYEAQICGHNVKAFLGQLMESKKKDKYKKGKYMYIVYVKTHNHHTRYSILKYAYNHHYISVDQDSIRERLLSSSSCAPASSYKRYPQDCFGGDGDIVPLTCCVSLGRLRST